MASALVPLAEGVEEMEAVIIIDVLRRANWHVVSAAISPSPLIASRGVRLLPDQPWEATDISDFDALVLPGGLGGTDALAAHEGVLDTIRQFLATDKWVGAICAAPLVLQAAGVLAGRQVTCHPGVAERLTATPRREERVVVDGHLVTSQGPGSAFEFALTLISCVDTPEVADAVASGLVLASGSSSAGHQTRD